MRAGSFLNLIFTGTEGSMTPLLPGFTTKALLEGHYVSRPFLLHE